MANPLSPTQQDLQEALQVVRRAKVLVTKLSKDSDHVWLKDKMVDVNSLLLERHSSHEEVTREIHSNLLISSHHCVRQTAHAEIVEFLQSDVEMEGPSQEGQIDVMVSNSHSQMYLPTH